MHDIQKFILKQLSTRANCRYRDIKPSEVEGNLFAYHLKSVLDEDLVEKVGNIYQLTDKGKKLSIKLTSTNWGVREQPVLATMIICRHNNLLVLAKRVRQPLHELYTFPFGKVHFGESLEQAASRECAEKIGSTLAKLKHLGTAELNIINNKTVIGQYVFIVYEAKVNDLDASKARLVDENHLSEKEIISATKQIFDDLITKKLPHSKASVNIDEFHQA